MRIRSGAKTTGTQNTKQTQASVQYFDVEGVGGATQGPVYEHRANAIQSRGNAAPRVGGVKSCVQWYFHTISAQSMRRVCGERSTRICFASICGPQHDTVGCMMWRLIGGLLDGSV